MTKANGVLADGELASACAKLPDGGDYLFIIVDEKKNRAMPTLSYLFSVVLGYLSDRLPDHPSTAALYRYFEGMFAPVHTVRINGEPFGYRDLKREQQIDVNDVVEKIIEYASKQWGIEIPPTDDFKEPDVREFYSQAYLQQQVDWNSFISSRKKLSKNERRNQKDERV